MKASFLDLTITMFCCYWVWLLLGAVLPSLIGRELGLFDSTSASAGIQGVDAVKLSAPRALHAARASTKLALHGALQGAARRGALSHAPAMGAGAQMGEVHPHF